MSFNIDDKVVVTAEMGDNKGKQGVITKIFESGGMLVLLEDGKISGFFASELEIADPRREALIRLAETLDSARKQANNLNGMDGTVYQSITTPLISVLDALVPFENVGYDAYEFLIEDGLSVREALKKVEK